MFFIGGMCNVYFDNVTMVLGVVEGAKVHPACKLVLVSLVQWHWMASEEAISEFNRAVQLPQVVRCKQQPAKVI
jgi:hypothetical protein